MEIFSQNLNQDFSDLETWFSIRGNPKYKISNKLRIHDISTKLEVSGTGQGNFKVSLFDLAEKEYSKVFLWHLSSTQVYIHPSFPHHVNKLKFVKNGLVKSRDPVIPIFIEPQYLDNDPTLRFVPGNSFLLARANGEIMFLRKDLTMFKKTITGTATYPVINIFGRTSVPVHRLIALTWCVPKGAEELIVVDHIDGNKKNFNSTNLRWVTYSENILATKLQGTHPNNRKVVVRNIETKEVREFLSITDSSVFIGRSRMSYTNIELLPGKIWNGKNGYFEIKYKDDNTDWVYSELPKDLRRSSTELSKEENPLKKGDKTLVIRIPGQDVKIFKSIEDLLTELLGVEKTLENMKNYEKLILSKFPTAIISLDNGRVYEARNYTTNEIVYGSAIDSVAGKIGLKKSTAVKYCKLGKIYNGWLIRLKNKYIDVPWPEMEETIPANTTIQYSVENLENGEVTTVESLRKLATFVGISRKSLKRYIGGRYRNLLIKEISRTRQDLSENNIRNTKSPTNSDIG